MFRKNESEEVLFTDLKDNLEHGICVSNLTYLLAKDQQLDDEFCNDLAIAGLVHDIGKLRLSGYLYGRLDFDNFGENVSYTRANKDSAHYMRMHSKLSYDILKEKGYNERILLTVLHHHENYDGSGYPMQLAGEDIPLGARIMRVADTFTALTSERPYRHAFDPDTAMEIMIDEIEFYDMKYFLALQRLVNDEATLKMMITSKESLTLNRRFGRFFG